MQTQMGKQQGFTLIEIAIVLVIIGLLLGGVLKGQEMINNGKIKNAMNDLNGVTAASNAYRDRYKNLPGDDGPTNTITSRGGSWASLTGGNGDGLVGNAAANPFAGTPASENMLFWQHLRASGLITGDATLSGATALPKNAWGGQEGITRGVYNGMGNVVCFQNVPGSAALALDNQFDDGNAATGSIRSNANGTTVPSPNPTNATPGATAYIEANNYTLCRTM